MQTEFKSISPSEISQNFIHLIGAEWMLITSGDTREFNMMTANWGGVGHLWYHDVCFIFVRPQRYTYEFTERYEYFTLTFFEEKYKHILQYCGSHSGRHVDKVQETGLTPEFLNDRSIYFQEARLAIECRKLFFQDIKSGVFHDPHLADKIYPSKDFHRMYIGKIETVLLKEK